MRRKRLLGRLSLLGGVALVAMALVIVLAVLQLTGVTGGSKSDSGSAKTKGVPNGGKPFSKGTGATRTLQQLAARLPLDRQVAQLFVVGFLGFDTTSPFFAQLQVRDWGGVVVTRDNYRNIQQLTKLAVGITTTAAAVGHVPPLVVAPQAGGRGTAFPNLPPDAEPGITSVVEAQRQARLAGKTLRGLGVNMVFAPEADLAVPGGPAANHSFGPDPATVATLTRAAVTGWSEARVAAVVGHFPGQGSASIDPDIGPATVGGSLEDLTKRDIVPFAAIAHRAPAIMLSNAAYTAFDGVSPAPLWPAVMGGVLRTQLGFAGLIVCGDLGATATAINEPIGRVAVQALLSGCDVLYVQGDPRAEEQAYEAVLAAARSGRLPRIGLQASLYRTLALKAHFGVIAPAGAK